MAAKLPLPRGCATSPRSRAATVEPVYTAARPAGDAQSRPGLPGELSRTPAASTPRCTAAGSGPCASSPASARRRTPTSATSSCSSAARPASRSRSTFPTLMGYDSDHPRSEGEVGKCGVAISSLADMETLFDGIPLDQVSTSMTINGPAAMLFCFYVAAAETPGRADRAAAGHDPERHPQGVHGAARLDLPGGAGAQDHRGPVRVGGGAHAEVEHDLDLGLPHPRGGRHGGAGAGLHAGQRLLLRGARRSRAGSTWTASRPRLSFFWDVHNDFFEEIAKLRAARRIWARHMRERYGAPDRAELADAVPLPDRRRHAHRAAAAEQRRAGGLPGAGRGAGRHPVAAHQRAGRDARAPDRGVGADRAPDPADPGLRDRRAQRGRPAGRLVLRRGADRRAGARGRGALRRDRGAGRRGAARSRPAGSSARSPAVVGPVPGARWSRAAGSWSASTISWRRRSRRSRS